MTYQQYIISGMWYRLRDEAIISVGGRCQGCSTYNNLQGHHRVYPKQWRQDCIDNLIILCKDCHRALHKLPPITSTYGRTVHIGEIIRNGLTPKGA